MVAPDDRHVPRPGAERPALAGRDGEPLRAPRALRRARGFDPTLPSGGDYDFVERAVEQGPASGTRRATVRHPTMDQRTAFLRKVRETNRWSAVRRLAPGRAGHGVRARRFRPGARDRAAPSPSARPALQLQQDRLKAPESRHVGAGRSVPSRRCISSWVMWRDSAACGAGGRAGAWYERAPPEPGSIRGSQRPIPPATVISKCPPLRRLESTLDRTTGGTAGRCCDRKWSGPRQGPRRARESDRVRADRHPLREVDEAKTDRRLERSGLLR